MSATAALCVVECVTEVGLHGDDSLSTASCCPGWGEMKLPACLPPWNSSGSTAHSINTLLLCVRCSNSGMLNTAAG